jgi:predicted ATPase
MTKIVLTGGPSGGKTTLAQAIQKEFTSRVAVVPEAATIVYSGDWPRRKTQIGVQHQQRAIYYVQRELESLISEENQGRTIVCDRGSLDGMAYWPGPGPATDFLMSIKSELSLELARYQWVIHLDTAPASYYDLTNPLRNESFEEATALNLRVQEAWAGHPQRIVIDNTEGGHFLDKLNRALFVLDRILEGHTFSEIQSMVLSDP